MAEINYHFVGENTILVKVKGAEVLNHPMLNKGTAFSQKERKHFQLDGHLPFHISTLEEQTMRRYKQFSYLANDLDRYEFLSSLQDRNEVLFFYLLYRYPEELMPYVYTPTVGEASLQFSTFYTRHRGLYLSYPMQDRLEVMIDNLGDKEIDVIVITDGERILGLGDLGVGGMAIPIGKTTLYTAFGGIHPAKLLPVVLDVGTNNPELLDDPLYIGWRHKRVEGIEYGSFIDKVITLVKRKWPDVVLQWEDFAKPNAYPLLEKYQKEICSFNDDIQGTAAVVLTAILSALELTKEPLEKQKIAILGGGSAGMGIVSLLCSALVAQGVSPQEATRIFYIVDIEGLVHDGLNPSIQHRPYSRREKEIKQWKVGHHQHITLLEVIENVHPTILIGVSGQKGGFNEAMIREMAKGCERPILLPLSNPLSKCEATPQELIAWSFGKGIIATGSPFPKVDYEGKKIPISQCNNVYIFPGVGLGALSVKATEITNSMFLAAAKEVSLHSPLLVEKQGPLLPRLSELRTISEKVGMAVAHAAIDAKVASAAHEDVEALVKKNIWTPCYPKLITE